MAKAPSVLYLIVARGGSKGLPRKNLATIGGLSLVGFKALAARKAASCSRLIISTDDTEIQEEARKHAVEVLFTRPAKYATDRATSASVVKHAIWWMERKEKSTYDAIMLLEPSSPFATPEHFDEAVRQFRIHKADLVVGMRPMEPSSLFVGRRTPDGSISNIVKRMNRAPSLRRQDQPEEWTMNGALYLLRWSAFKETGRIYSSPNKCFGIMMDRWHSIEIETAADLEVAELAVKHNHISIAAWTSDR